jgi:SAM-dependent methyltransferase
MKKKNPTQQLYDVSRAFQRSRALLTAVELDIFTVVAGGADTPKKAAAAMHADERGTRALMRALAGMGFLARRAGCYGLTPAGRLLVDGNGKFRRKAFLHSASGWERWSRLTEAVVRGKLRRSRKRVSSEKKWREHFIAAMESSSSIRAAALEKAARPMLAASRTLLDLGGGSGGYTKTFLGKHPGLQATVFDTPGVIPLTRRYLGGLATGRRAVRLLEGDFLRDDIGSGYDMVLLSSIIHIYSARTNTLLLRKIRRALSPGGWLVIQDFILDDNETEPVEAALFGLHMLVSTSEGGTYTRGEVRRWLGSAGFGQIRSLAVPGPSSVMAARRK